MRSLKSAASASTMSWVSIGEARSRSNSWKGALYLDCTRPMLVSTCVFQLAVPTPLGSACAKQSFPCWACSSDPRKWSGPSAAVSSASSSIAASMSSRYSCTCWLIVPSPMSAEASALCRCGCVAKRASRCGDKPGRCRVCCPSRWILHPMGLLLLGLGVARCGPSPIPPAEEADGGAWASCAGRCHA